MEYWTKPIVSTGLNIGRNISLFFKVGGDTICSYACLQPDRKKLSVELISSDSTDVLHKQYDFSSVTASIWVCSYQA